MSEIKLLFDDSRCPSCAGNSNQALHRSEVGSTYLCATCGVIFSKSNADKEYYEKNYCSIQNSQLERVREYLNFFKIMKILYHHRTLGDGAEGIHVSAIVDAFKSVGHETKVVAMIGEKTNVATSRGRLLSSLRKWMPGVVSEVFELGYTLLGYRMIRNNLSDWKADFIYERYTLFNFSGLLAAWRTNIPLVLEVNSPLAYERAAYEHLTLKRLARQCERFICSKAALVVVVSTPLKEHLIQQGMVGDNILVVPNGADVNVFKPDLTIRQTIRASLGIDQGAVVVGFVGFLRPWHGVDSLSESIWNILQKNMNLHLLIVGDGPSRADLESFIRMHGIEAYVTVTGRVSHSEIPRYVMAFDIGVSPRATFYASPMKIVEYMATGIPVVAPRISNIQDLITDGVNGLLFEPENIESLTATLESLIINPTLRQRLGVSARETVIGHRTWNHNAQSVIDHLSMRAV